MQFSSFIYMMAEQRKYQIKSQVKFSNKKHKTKNNTHNRNRSIIIIIIIIIINNNNNNNNNKSSVGIKTPYPSLDYITLLFSHVPNHQT
jgi:uncharacterized membrane protein YkgB